MLLYDEQGCCMNYVERMFMKRVLGKEISKFSKLEIPTTKIGRRRRLS